ncbi:uncharacterized protein LOC135925865 isoform X2 [Gordionus sp. m RMFG-2023]|uniref:uncharacterized protein LOC135925865 isoform X2 n=1 Tax=Gordionus sp. m RMFG-2023 TaxID=3053472 RepID=UPI0031FDB86D
MDASTQTNISLFLPTSNVCTAECQTFNLQVFDITNSPIMNPEVLEEIDAHNRIINSPIMNPEVLEEIDAHNRIINSPIMNPEVLEDIDAHNRIINSPIMNRVVLEEIDAYNGGTTSPTIIQNNHSFIKSKNNKNMIYYNKYLYVYDFGDLYYKCRKNSCKGRGKFLFFNSEDNKLFIFTTYKLLSRLCLAEKFNAS